MDKKIQAKHRTVNGPMEKKTKGTIPWPSEKKKTVPCLLYPKEYCKSIYEYDFDKAYREGKRLVLFDIDNTFVPHGAPADEKSIALAAKLKEMGFELMAVSNNKEKRVKSFCDSLNISYIENAKKPSAKGYLRAVSNSAKDISQTIFFGDQIFTDILGANRAGIDTVLVRPVDTSTDEIQIVLKRMLEKPVIKAYFRKNSIDFSEYF